MGPKDKFGEGSIYLAEKLVIHSTLKHGGTSSRIEFVLIKNSGIGKVLRIEEIQEIGYSKLTESDIVEILKNNSNNN